MKSERSFQRSALHFCLKHYHVLKEITFHLQKPLILGSLYAVRRGRTENKRGRLVGKQLTNINKLRSAVGWWWEKCWSRNDWSMDGHTHTVRVWAGSWQWTAASTA